MAENDDNILVFKQEERSPCGRGCAKNSEDMDVENNSTAAFHRSEGKSSSPHSLTQILTNLPSSNLSFDLPEIQSPTTSGLISPIGPTSRLGKKRPLSISPLSSSSINIDALVRGSPVSLINFLSSSRNSSAGSFGHLSPSIFSVPSGYSQYNKPAISLSKAVHPTPSYSKSADDRGELYKDHEPDEPDETESGMKLEFVDIPSDHDATYLPPRLILDQDAIPAFPDIDEHIELGQSTEYPVLSEFKTSRSSNSRVKRIYYAYPPIETPHNNKCMWKDCKQQCESLEELVTHVNKEHIYQDSRKEFICRWEGCVREGRAFKAQYMLLVHMRRHTGEKPHKCQYEGCDKAYSRLENLKTHLRSHTGEKPYICKYEGCGKAFSNASDCAKHMNRTHSDEKPYGCLNPGCNKRYTDPSSRRKHMKNCQVNKKARVSNGEITSGTDESAMETSSQPLEPIATSASTRKTTSKNRKNECKKKNNDQEKILSPSHIQGNNSQSIDLGYLSGSSQCTPAGLMAGVGITGNPPVGGSTPLSGYNSSGCDTEYPSLPDEHGMSSLINGSTSDHLMSNHVANIPSTVKTEQFSPPSQCRDLPFGQPPPYKQSFLHGRKYQQPTSLHTLPEIIGPTQSGMNGHSSGYLRNRSMRLQESGYSSGFDVLSNRASDEASIISGSSGLHHSLRSSDLSSSSTLSSRLSSPTSGYRRDGFDLHSKQHSMKPPDLVLKPLGFPGMLHMADFKNSAQLSQTYYSRLQNDDIVSVRSSHSSRFSGGSFSDYSDDFHHHPPFADIEFSSRQPLPPITNELSFIGTCQSQTVPMNLESSQFLPPASSISNLHSPAESYTDSMSGGSIPLQHLEISPQHKAALPMVIDSHVRSDSPNLLIGNMSSFSNQLQQDNILFESLASTSTVGQSNLVQLPH